MNKYAKQELKQVVGNVFTRTNIKGWEDAMFTLGEEIICNILALSDQEITELGFNKDRQ